MNNYPGKLIVIYGVNNLGKSTQAKLLVDNLKQKGIKAEYLKYPVYNINPSGEILNDYLRGGNFYNLSPKEAQIIYALNRTQYQEELIKKLKSGINIIAEDYSGTGICWGLGAGVSETFLKLINSHLIKEDLVFLFDGERFEKAIEKNHKHEINNDLTNKVRWAHLKLKEEFGWIKINANLTIEEIEEIIWNKVYSFLTNKDSDLKDRKIENNKEKYNYSGFKAVNEIINNNHKEILSKIDIFKEKNVQEQEVINEIVLEKKQENCLEQDSLLVERIRPEAKLPNKAHENDAGFDLFSSEYYSIPAYGQALVETGVKIAIPDNHVGLIWDKSGLANEGITTMGGVIDSGYRGEIKVIVKNLSEDIFNIIPGQKIAQLIIQAISPIKIRESRIENNSKRGEGGFGSTGNF